MGDDDTRDRRPVASTVTSVDRALRLITALREQGSVSVREAAEHLDVAPSTAHRLLSSLVAQDFAVQNHLRRYVVGPALVDPPHDVTAGGLRRAALPLLRRLHSSTGETAQLVVLRGGQVQFLDGVESTHPLRVARRVGDRMPAFVSAGGKALLALLPNADLERLYRNRLPAWPTSRVSSVAALKRQMAGVRRDGFATNIEETEQGVVGVGVALGDHSGRPMAAMTVATPSVRFSPEAVPEHVDLLDEAIAGLRAWLHTPA